MTEDSQRETPNDFIERIVREVLARLEGTHGAKSGTTTDDTNNTDHRNGTSQQPARRTLTDRVITADSLHGRLNGIGEISIHAKAVVTPAAGELLRDAAVRIVRGGGVDRETKPEAANLVVGVADCIADMAAVSRLEEVHGGAVQHVARTGLVGVVYEMTEQVVLGGKKGVVFTDNSTAAVCLANRKRGVRAVTESSVDGVSQAVASVGANTLVIRPAGLTTWQQLQMVRVFMSSPAVCPEELASALA